MFLRAERAWLLALPALYFLYFFDISGMGLVTPDEPRYAWIGREMARSGDWITPRLWGAPWFEKPALLYWLIGAAFRLGWSEDLAPRLPIAAVSVTFLLFFGWILKREFGMRPAWFATGILATSTGWLAYSHVGVTDLPMSAAFSAAMLLALPWLRSRDVRWLTPAGGLLGVAVLAKGLVPLALTLPLFCMGRRQFADLLRPSVIGAFLLVSVPWYALCYFRNGVPFLKEFFWQHHWERYATDSLQHGQPFWFYLPILAAGLLPWTPLVALFRRSLLADRRQVFLLSWVAFGLVFFSLSANKLPGYILPLLPPLAVLLGLALAERERPGWALAACALCLGVIFPAVGTLPRALADGLSRTDLPRFHWSWLLPVPLAVYVWRARRERAVAVLLGAAVLGIAYFKTAAFPEIDRSVSARPLWRQIAAQRDQVCVETMHRSWRYGLNYYSVAVLPDCAETPRTAHIRQAPGYPPEVIWSNALKNSGNDTAAASAPSIVDLPSAVSDATAKAMAIR